MAFNNLKIIAKVTMFILNPESKQTRLVEPKIKLGMSLLFDSVFINLGFYKF
jgi:hypothetical protein